MFRYSACNRTTCTMVQQWRPVFHHLFLGTSMRACRQRDSLTTAIQSMMASLLERRQRPAPFFFYFIGFYNGHDSTNVTASNLWLGLQLSQVTNGIPWCKVYTMLRCKTTSVKSQQDVLRTVALYIPRVPMVHVCTWYPSHQYNSQTLVTSVDREGRKGAWVFNDLYSILNDRQTYGYLQTQFRTILYISTSTLLPFPHD